MVASEDDLGHSFMSLGFVAKSFPDGVLSMRPGTRNESPYPFSSFAEREVELGVPVYDAKQASLAAL